MVNYETNIKIREVPKCIISFCNFQSLKLTSLSHFRFCIENSPDGRRTCLVIVLEATKINFDNVRCKKYKIYPHLSVNKAKSLASDVHV